MQAEVTQQTIFTSQAKKKKKRAMFNFVAQVIIV
jgi:hypothetical protein